MSKAITDQPTPQRHVHVRSKSSNAQQCFDNKCRHQICTCYKPSHKCPIDYNKPGYLPPSHYQQEFVKRDGVHVEAIRPVDNLHNGKEFFEGTVYQREYHPHRTDVDLARQAQADQRLNTALKATNYGQDHLGYTTSLPTGNSLKGTYAERNLGENYPKPAKFVIPRSEVVDKKAMQKESEYGREFRPPKRDNSANTRINYDNLHVGGGPANPPVTTYQAEHVARDPSKIVNDHMADLNKRNNQLTYAQFLPKDNYGKQTEYSRKYDGKKPVYGDCPISDLPSLTSSQKRLPEHMYFNCQEAKWKASKA